MLRAGRQLLVGGLLTVAVACRAKSYSPSSADAGGGGGDDASTPCSCALPNAGGARVIPCGATGCADNVTYLCTDVGTALPGMPCGVSDAGRDGPGDCVTTCTGKTCNVPDGCGGLCKCAPGVTCDPDTTCGNGCDLAVGDVCADDGGASTTCCGTGLVCLAHDSGVSACCAIIGGGAHCTQDTDCCDYPVAHCSTSTGTCG